GVARTRGDVARPADVPGFSVATIDAAAQAARGQRVLAILVKPGSAATGRILESAQAAEGWKPFRATFDEKDPLLAALDGLAAAALRRGARGVRVGVGGRGGRPRCAGGGARGWGRGVRRRGARAGGCGGARGGAGGPAAVGGGPAAARGSELAMLIGGLPAG